jgi:tetratricopeptide (TPR) repeat protein
VTADRKTGSYLIQSADRIHAYRQIPTRPDDAPPVASAGDAPYDRTAVESRVADYYQSIRRPVDELRSIDDLAPQIAEYRHRLRAGEFDAALELLDTIDQPYLFVWGHYTKLVELRQLVLDAPASPKLCAANAASLGLVSQVLGLYDDALRYYERAVDTATRTGDAAAQAEYVGDLGRLYRNLGYMDKAIASSQKALDAATEASDRRAQGRWKDRLGLTYAFVGRLDDGLRLLEEALGIAREFGDRRSEGAATSNIGLIQQIQGKIDDAERAYRDSLAITREIGDRRGDAIILGRLGFIAEGRGDYVGALRQHREALDISISLGERREQSYQLLGLGRARSGVNEPEEAEQLLRQSRDMDMPETGYLAGLALGLLLLRRGSQEAAAALEDTIARCDDRLARSGELFATRYARATALAAMAVGDPAWAAADSAARSGMLGPAADEMDRALAICPAVGIVSATVRDLDAIPIDDPALLAPLRSKLDAILADAPRAVPATMPIESTEGQP